MAAFETLSKYLYTPGAVNYTRLHSGNLSLLKQGYLEALKPLLTN